MTNNEKVKTCDVCGKPLVKGINKLTEWAKRCVDIRGYVLSECQKTKNKETAKACKQASNKREKEISTKAHHRLISQNDEQMRECLRCEPDPITGIVPKFLSKGKHNRICERCNRVEVSINVSNLGRIPGLVSDIDFINY